MQNIRVLDIPGYEKVIEATDDEAHLHCFIAIDNTDLGPALGGVRIYPYNSSDEALQDVLLLAKAMTKKSALAQLGLGGGKSVIIADPKLHKTKDLLHAFGEVINSLKGQYIAAEDVGSSLADMSIIRETSPYVAALPTKKSSGDPSRFTAWGVFRGIQAAAQFLWGSPSVKGKRIAIQGLGHVGANLADYLFWHGAELIVADIDQTHVERAVQLYHAEVVAPEKILSVECDIFSPCAMGGILSESSIKLLRCKAVAGGANNQLQKESDGMRLFESGFVYAPDFIINAGGIINAAMEFEQGGYNPKTSQQKVDNLYEILLEVFDRSRAEGKPTSVVAEELAAAELMNKLSKRGLPIQFH